MGDVEMLVLTGVLSAVFFSVLAWVLSLAVCMTSTAEAKEARPDVGGAAQQHRD